LGETPLFLTEQGDRCSYIREIQGPPQTTKEKHLASSSRYKKDGKQASLLALTGVLQTGSNALHGQDEGVLQPRGVLAGRVQRHKLGSRLACVHDLLGKMGPQSDVIVWVADPLQCVGLADVHGGDVRVTESEPLLQVGITFKKILVSSNLKSRNSSFVTIIFTAGSEDSIFSMLEFVVEQRRRFLNFSKTHLKKKLLGLFIIGPQLVTEWL
jgi:hypothetical protein